MEKAIRQVRPHWATALVIACALGAAARILVMIDRHAVDVPFWDQFTFYQALIGDPSAWDLFRWQHGPHRQGLPFLLTAALARATDWNFRGDAFLVGGAACAATALALWLRRRLCGPLHAGDVAIPLLLLTPAQYGIFVHSPNLSHGAGPLVLLLAFGLSFTIERRALRYPALAALAFALVHSGFGLFAGVLAPPLLLLCALGDARARGPRAAVLPLLCSALCVVGLAIFAIGYDPHDVEAVSAQQPPLAAYALYVALMFANLLGLKGAGLWPVLGGGLAVLAVLAVAAEQLVASLRAPASPRRLAILTLTSFSLLFAAATAYGRIALGFPGAQATRYVPLLAPALFGIYLRIQEIARPRIRAAVLAASGVAIALATFPMRAPEAQFMEHLSRGKRAWVAAYLATGDLAQANAQAGLAIFPFDGPEVPRVLAYLREHHLSFYADRTHSGAGEPSAAR